MGRGEKVRWRGRERREGGEWGAGQSSHVDFCGVAASAPRLLQLMHWRSAAVENHTCTRRAVGPTALEAPIPAGASFLKETRG